MRFTQSISVRITLLIAVGLGIHTLLSSQRSRTVTSSPEASSQEPIHISGGVMAGNIVTKPSPAYPEGGCAAHAFGAVAMKVIIARDGHVKSVEAVSGHPLLREPYVEAVRRYRYHPYLLNGKPVEVQTTVVLNPSINCDAAKALGETQPLRVSGGIIAGNILTKVQPSFPEEARQKHINGTVVVYVVIGKDGYIKTAQAISGPELLRKPYVDAVRQWVYKPYLLNGNPVEVATTITINIQLNGDS